MESVRLQYEKRISTLTTANRELSNKLAAKTGTKDASLSKREVDRQVRVLYVCLCRYRAKRSKGRIVD